MSNKQLTLFLSVLFASSDISAQSLQFNNGDTLEVELIYQTDKTLTFSHIALGEQTIDKSKISNLQDMNLSDLVKLNETQVNNIKKVNTAEAKVSNAEARVNTAKTELIAAKVAFDKTKQADSQERLNRANVEEKLILAGDKFIASQEDLKRAKNELKVIKAVIVAETQLSEAQVKADQAKAEMLAVGEKSIAEKLGIATADTKVDIAENKLNVAMQHVQKAEHDLKLAKGEKINDGFMGTGWFKDWDSRVELGLKGSSGSSANTTFRTAFNSRYEDRLGRWDFKSFYLFDSEDSISSENKVNATLVKDWFFPDTQWFAFASMIYDWDKFKDWNHRVQFTVGPGYQFYKTEDWDISGRIGGSGIVEFGKTVDDLNSPTGLSEKDILGFEGMAGIDLTWHITAKQQFLFSNYIYPSLTNRGEFRNLTNISWIHSIDWFEGLALKFGIRNEYDTTESERNDFKYNFSLLWGF